MSRAARLQIGEENQGLSGCSGKRGGVKREFLDQGSRSSSTLSSSARTRVEGSSRSTPAMMPEKKKEVSKRSNKSRSQPVFWVGYKKTQRDYTTGSSFLSRRKKERKTKKGAGPTKEHQKWMRRGEHNGEMGSYVVDDRRPEPKGRGVSRLPEPAGDREKKK